MSTAPGERSIKQVMIYVHGKGGSAAEAARFRPLFAEGDVLGFDYQAQNPWEAVEEFPGFFSAQRSTYGRVILLANSIGAFFSMCALSEAHVDRALLISPVVSMEKLIENMMQWENISEAELQNRKEIPTGLGETLSWDYLAYVRAHPIRWNVPTHILYGEADHLTSPEIISAFANRIDAELTIMPRGAHWFHTDEQMAFLDDWIQRSI